MTRQDRKAEIPVALRCTRTGCDDEVVLLELGLCRAHGRAWRRSNVVVNVSLAALCAVSTPLLAAWIAAAGPEAWSLAMLMAFCAVLLFAVLLLLARTNQLALKAD